MSPHLQVNWCQSVEGCFTPCIFACIGCLLEGAQLWAANPNHPHTLTGCQRCVVNRMTAGWKLYSACWIFLFMHSPCKFFFKIFFLTGVLVCHSCLNSLTCLSRNRYHIHIPHRVSCHPCLQQCLTWCLSHISCSASAILLRVSHSLPSLHLLQRLIISPTVSFHPYLPQWLHHLIKCLT